MGTYFQPPPPRPLTVLSVAYPFARVRPDSIGGAEQVLSMLDAGLVARGHRSIVIAAEGSRTAGELIEARAGEAPANNGAWSLTHAAVRGLLAGVIEAAQPDVIHLHGLDFDAYLPPAGAPVLVTLHLPLEWYRPEALAPERPLTWLLPVSMDQASRAAWGAELLAPIENGVDIDRFAPPFAKRGFALALGRVCPEKGFHLALEAARMAEASMLLAGRTYAYPEHERYFAEEIAPRLDRRRRWVGEAAGRRKQRLLGSARCLLVPSLAPETSSLVAREALASGTPVIAFDNGALREVVEHGRTGFLVRSVEEMAEAIRLVGAIDPEACRAAARTRFSAETMIDRYIELYGVLTARAQRRIGDQMRTIALPC